MGHPLPETGLADITFIAFDSETTGLSPVVAKLVELSGVKFKLDGTELSTFSRLINPGIPIPLEATAVHGITDAMVAPEPGFSQIIPSFIQWVTESPSVLVAHNAPFDLGFLEVSLARLRLSPPPAPVLDTLALSRRMLPGVPNHTLRTLVEHLRLGSGDYHRALADSYHVRDLLCTLVRLEPGLRTWDDISNLCRPLSFSDRMDMGMREVEALPHRYQPLKRAIDEHLPLAIAYGPASTGERIVTPQSVHEWRGALYLTALCHIAEEERTFRMDRIGSLRLAEDSPSSGSGKSRARTRKARV